MCYNTAQIDNMSRSKTETNYINCYEDLAFFNIFNDVVDFIHEFNCKL